MTNLKLKENIIQFETSIQSMVDIIEKTEPALLYKKPSAEEWSVMQIASHVIEAVRFWVTDLEALLIVPGAKWGRNHEHVRRLSAVEENYVSALSKEQVIAELLALIPLTKQALDKCQEDDLVKTAPSYNPNFDGKSLSFLIDHLIIGHVNGHSGQMERHLAKVQL